MKNIKDTINEILSIQRVSADPNDYQVNTALILLIGYYSMKNYSDNVNIDIILNSSNIKEAFQKSLCIIAEEVEELKEAINYLNNVKLTSDEIAKVLVILRDSFFNEEQYRFGFDYMLDTIEIRSGRAGAEGMTPSFINKLAVQIIEPKEGDFYDGTFGFGGDSIEAYKFAETYGNELSVYGQEINKKIYSIACIRMFINGISSEHIVNSDLLTSPILKEKKVIKKYDYIIMNPPFSMVWKDKEREILADKYARFIYGKPSVSSADWLFISSTLKSLKEQGKAVIITTLGSLFRGGAEEKLRKKIIGFDYIEAVIELTSGLFNSTNIPCALVVFNMNKEEHMKNKIQFINADSLYESVRRGKKILNDDNIEIILDIFRNKKVVEDISTIIDLSDIADGNLSPSRYVVQTEFESSYYGKVKIHLENLNVTKTLGDIGEFYRGINVTSKNVQDPNGNYKIINFADIKNGELDVDSLPSYLIENNARVESYKVEPGDIIISNKGATKICIIPEHEEDVLISQNFIGIRVKSNYNPQYIKEFLESPIGEYLIESRKTGTAVAMINTKDLKEIPVVDMGLEEQNEIIQKYNEEQKELQRKMDEIMKSMDRLKSDLYKEMNLEGTFKTI